MDQLEDFVRGLPSCSALLSRGTATVLGREVPAVLVRNLYGQEIVWGVFDCDKGKFRGKRLSNSASTEGVQFAPSSG